MLSIALDCRFDYFNYIACNLDNAVLRHGVKKTVKDEQSSLSARISLANIGQCVKDLARQLLAKILINSDDQHL